MGLRNAVGNIHREGIQQLAFPLASPEEMLMAVQRLRNTELDSLVSATSRRRVIHQVDQNQTWTQYGLSTWHTDCTGHVSTGACDLQMQIGVAKSARLVKFKDGSISALQPYLYY